MNPGPNNAITDVSGIKVGHAQNLEAATGCTVILCEDGAVAGVDQRGGAPGTRETDILRPMHRVERVHAVLLSGGSAFGLNAAAGVVKYLEEHDVGYDVQVAKVPIVPAAILFDLRVGDPNTRPDAAMGYAACEAASEGPVAQGSVGAGTGATIGGINGWDFQMKGGLGTASVNLNGVVVGAIVAVNSVGDVIDPATGKTIAGARKPPDGTELSSTLDTMKRMISDQQTPSVTEADNTVIGVVATNAKLTKEQVNKVAQMAQDGLARTIHPAHTMYDGDTFFALSIGDTPAETSMIGAVAAEVMEQAILNAIWSAESLHGVPSATEFNR